MLVATFDALAIVALAAWFGSVLFLSFGVAPVVFRALEPGEAARFLRALFPRYYAWNIYGGVVALGSLVCGRLAAPAGRGGWIGSIAGLILIGVLLSMYSLFTLTPAINRARDAGPAADRSFRRLHHLSVALNGVVLIVGLVSLVGFAGRPSKGAPQIQELSPAERIGRDGRVLQRRRAEAESAIRGAR